MFSSHIGADRSVVKLRSSRGGSDRSGRTASDRRMLAIPPCSRTERILGEIADGNPRGRGRRRRCTSHSTRRSMLQGLAMPVPLGSGCRSALGTGSTLGGLLGPRSGRTLPRRRRGGFRRSGCGRGGRFGRAGPTWFGFGGTRESTGRGRTRRSGGEGAALIGGAFEGVRSGPLEPVAHAAQEQLLFTAGRRAEMKNGAVAFDEHRPGTGFDLVGAERTLSFDHHRCRLTGPTAFELRAPFPEERGHPLTGSARRRCV
jgi:hypothetical protein